jgi:FlaA1/EpsC-like NDP-sugar epimerase
VKILVIGAGGHAQVVADALLRARDLGGVEELIGFVDDDPQKQDLTVRGIPIFGGRKDIAGLVERTGIDEVLIAMPSVSGETVREIVEICEDAGVKARILPALSELLTDDVSLRHLRPVELSDLLRRDPIQTDLAAVHELVKGKTVLVTGAGGSIGSELCRQIAKAQPASLILLGHGENSIFEIHNELRRDFSKGRISLEAIHPVIADVRDGARLEQVFRTHQPQVVFHAAAHKHVPLMESNPTDAITNNILGTHQLLQTCQAHDVRRFVLISTDKAVNPANIMGMTKRVAELLVLDAAQRSGRAYVAVRFGNVLGSRGSVVPFFKKQIEAGGPVTVTHRDVTRYFMTIPEAVQLVLQAAALGKGGELFMLDMGEPVKIVDLADDLIRLSGLTPGQDIVIE